MLREAGAAASSREQAAEVGEIGELNTETTDPAYIGLARVWRHDEVTPARIVPAERQEAGITDDLVRLSLGLEDPSDLCADLDRALGATS